MGVREQLLYQLGLQLLWYLEVYPTLAEEDKPYEVMQNTGDVIFVPRGWWHMVLNITDTVSVTQNFVNQQNLAEVSCMCGSCFYRKGGMGRVLVSPYVYV